MLDELKQILRRNAPDTYIYGPALFDMRLKEELLRSQRLHLPFVYLQIPTQDFSAIGLEKSGSDSTRAWKIAVLTLFTYWQPIDILGYLDAGAGLGIIMVGRTDEDVVKIKQQIIKNLQEADLWERIRLNPRSPFFRAFYCPAQIERERQRIERTMHAFNDIDSGLFRLEEYRYSRLWNNPWNRLVMNWNKRAIDFAGAAIGLLMLSPLIIGTALLVKITSPGPLFFGQTRIGKDGDRFTMWKFRSMYIDAERRKAELIAQGLNEEKGGPTFKMKNDPRITPIGRIIRKYSLDELPQLWNVLVGDMAIVGPRPPVPNEVEEYLPWHRMRLAVKPGLTCHWQVSGRSSIGFEEWMRLDNQYVRHGDLKTDMSLIGKTFRAVVKGDGAY